MRRRTDESHTRRAVTDARDVVIDFAPGQFAAFAGLCALGNFDLQLVGVGEIPNGDAETARGNLLNRRAFGVAVGQRIEALGIFATFASVALAAEAIHRDGQALVGLGGDGAETHRTGTKTLHDFAGRLDVVNGDWAAVDAFFEFHQPAQRAARFGVAVDVIGKLLVRIVIIRARGSLQCSDGFRIPHMLFALGAPVEFAGVRQALRLILDALGETKRVAAQHFLGKLVEVHALHTAGCTDEAAVDDVVPQTDGLENLRTFIRVQR